MKVLKIGDKFGNWVVLKYAEDIKNKRLYYCQCKCGTIKKVDKHNLLSYRTKGCRGCRCKDRIIEHPLYHIWSGIKARCSDENSPAYKNYGGRGIKVCDRWLESFENFKTDMGEKPSKKHSIDRINNDGDYEPNNCRWATQRMQSNNTRWSDKLTAKKVAELTGYSRERIRQLTYPNTSSPRTKKHPLVDFIDYTSTMENGERYIYKPKIINFLIKRREALAFKQI